MPEIITPLSTREIGIPKEQLATPEGIEQFKQEIRTLPNDDPEIEKSNFENHFSKILNLNDTGVFGQDETLKRRLPAVARNPLYLQWTYIFVDDCRLVLQETVDAPEELKHAAIQQLKDLQIVTKLCGLENPPQFTQQEEETYGKGNLEIVKKTWEERWPEIKAVFDTYILPTTEAVAAQTDRQQLPTSDVGSSPNDMGTRIGEEAVAADTEPGETTVEEEEEEASELVEQLITQEGITNKGAIDKWISALSPHARELKPDQLTQLHPYVLLRLISAGDLSKEQILSLPDRWNKVGSLEPAQQGIQSLRFAYAEVERVLSRYTDVKFSAMPAEQLRDIVLGYMEQVHENKIPVGWNFQKGQFPGVGFLERKVRTGEIAKRRQEAYNSLSQAYSEIFQSFASTSKFEKSLNPPSGPDDEPPADGSQGAIPPARSPDDTPSGGRVSAHNPDIPVPEPPPPNQNRSIIVEREPGGNFVRLDNYLKERGGKLPESEALEIGIKMAEYLATIHSQGIERDQIWDPYGLNAIYWDAKNKQLRLAKSDNERKGSNIESHGVLMVGSGDRQRLAELMFRLATGLTLHPPYNDTSQERENFKKEFGVLGFANLANMYAPKIEEIPAVLSPLSEGTRKVLIRALYPFMVGRDNGYGFRAADTKWMLLDLIAADKTLKGEPVSEQMQSYYPAAEYRRNYLMVMEGKRNHFQTEVPADLAKEIEADINQRMEKHNQTLDQINKEIADSYNWNLDKALENQ